MINVFVLILVFVAQSAHAGTAMYPPPSKKSDCSSGKQQMTQYCETLPQTTGFSPEALAGMIGDAGESQVGQGMQSAAANAEGTAIAKQVADYCGQSGQMCADGCEQQAKLEEAIPITGKAKPAATRAQGKQCQADADAKRAPYDAAAADMAPKVGESMNTADAAQGTQGQGNGQLVGALAAAGVAAGVLCMTGSICKKKEKEEEGKTPEDDPNPIYTAEQCKTKEDAYKNDGCFDGMLSSCFLKFEEGQCGSFVEYYCGSSGGTGNGATTTANSTHERGGIGTNFCQVAMSSAYCKDGGNTTCPSCANLVRMSSPSCETNPAACMPEMTQPDKEAALTSCPTDPLFSNPLFFVSADDDGSSTISGGESTINGGTGTGYTSLVSYGSGNQGSSNGVYSNGDGVGGQAAIGSGVNGHAGANGASQAGNAGSTDVAGVGQGQGSSIGRSIASIQVAPDIAPAIGSSLFARHSKWVQSRCIKGAVNNCGPRSGTGTASSTAE